MRSGLDFARVIRAMLRQAPNIILVGEMRDLETAADGNPGFTDWTLGIQYATYEQCAQRYYTFDRHGRPSYLVASTIVAIMAQRLVRVVCRNASSPIRPTTPLEAAGITREMAATANFCKGRGCGNCQGSGFRGRLGISS